MSPDQDALALVEGIERASRRSRPFFLFGLAAVILGFATISVYLYQDREEERAQKLVLERQVGELTRTLNEAHELWPHLDDSAAARDRLRILLGQASNTARLLPAAVAEAESEAEVAVPAPRIPEQASPQPPAQTDTGRLLPKNPPLPPQPGRTTIAIAYLVASGEQRTQVAGLHRSLRRSPPGSLSIGPGSPEIILVPRGDNSILCYRPEDCRRVRQLAAALNSRLASPRLRAREVASTAMTRATYPPGTFVVRFAPGPIRLSRAGE